VETISIYRKTCSLKGESRRIVMEEEISAPPASQKGWLERHGMKIVAGGLVLLVAIFLLAAFGGSGDSSGDIPVIVEQMPPRTWGEVLALMSEDEAFRVFVQEAFCLTGEDLSEVLVPLENAGKSPAWVYPQGYAQAGGKAVGVIASRPTSWARIQQVLETDTVFRTYWSWFTGMDQEEINSYLELEAQGWEVFWTFPEGKVQLVSQNRGNYLLGTQEVIPVCPSQPTVTQPTVTQPTVTQPGVTDVQSVTPGEARVWATPPFKLYWETEGGQSWGDFFEVNSGSRVEGESIMVWMPPPEGLVRPVLKTGDGKLLYGAWV
jgi:hypothetical protein